MSAPTAPTSARGMTPADVDLAPFRIPGPALLSVSGGETSGYMLDLTVRAWDGTLPPNVYPVFANTGEEHPGTLAFVQAMSERWGIPITWLEYDGHRPRLDMEVLRDSRAGKRMIRGGKRVKGPLYEYRMVPQFKIVTYETASRDGQPYEDMSISQRYVPNAVQRICTKILKMWAFQWFMGEVMGHGGMGDWTNVVGIRADEPTRVADLKLRNTMGDEDNRAPLADAGIEKPDVRAWWDAQPFRLRDFGVRWWEGNCMGCHLKGIHQRVRVARDHPSVPRRLLGHEQLVGASHDKAWPMARIIGRADLPMLPGMAEEEEEAMIAEEAGRVPCTCHD